MSARPCLSSLQNELGNALPADLSKLKDEEIEALTRALAQARANQSTALDQALARALEFVPGMMRGTIRRILGL